MTLRMTPTPLSRRSNRNCSVRRGLVVSAKLMVGIICDPMDEIRLISEGSVDRSFCHEETSSDSLPEVRFSLSAVNLCVSWIGPDSEIDCISSLLSSNMELGIRVGEIGRGPVEMAITRVETRRHSNGKRKKKINKGVWIFAGGGGARIGIGEGVNDVREKQARYIQGFRPRLPAMK
ncbi:hypothetical protein VTK26DRAFT_5944 [Humicola hyalothermophila]